VVYGNTGAAYYAASDGTTAIFGKDDEKGKRVWAKSYENHRFSSKSFIVSPDENFMYTIDDSTTGSLNILRINALTGTLITQYTR